MKKTMMCLICLGLVMIPSLCFSQEEDLKLVEVTEKLHVVSGGGGNMAFLITADGVVAVDSGYNPEIGAQALNLFRKVSDKPISHLIYTHYHQDHTNGAGAFPENVRIIASKNTEKNMTEFLLPRLKELQEKILPEQLAAIKKKVVELTAANSPELDKAKNELADMEKLMEIYKKTRPRLPLITYEKEMALTLGDQEIILIQPGHNHTDGDTAVYFKTQKVLHMGDMLFHLTIPYIDWKAGSDTENWIKTLGEFQKWDAVKVIPGHGEMTDKTGLAKMAVYLEDLRQAVSDALKRGESLEEMKQSITLPAYKDYGFRNFLPVDIEAVRHELTAKKAAQDKR